MPLRSVDKVPNYRPLSPPHHHMKNYGEKKMLFNVVFMERSQKLFNYFPAFIVWLNYFHRPPSRYGGQILSLCRRSAEQQPRPPQRVPSSATSPLCFLPPQGRYTTLVRVFDFKGTFQLHNRLKKKEFICAVLL